MQFQSFEKPLTLHDLLSAGFRYKWRFAFVTALTLALGITGIFLFPRRYDSEAKLMVKLSRDFAAIDPTTMGQTISIQESRESEITSIMDLLSSRGLAERVVDKIGVDQILKKHSWVEVKIESLMDVATGFVENFSAADDSEGESTGESIADLKLREAAIKAVTSGLGIKATKKATNIAIHYRATSPQLAQQVVSEVIACYRQMQTEAHQSHGTYEFFDKQFASHNQNLKDLEELLKSKKNDSGVVTIQGKQDSLQSELTSVEQMQLNATADLEAGRAKVLKLTASLESMPAELLSEKSSGNPQQSTDFMRDRLYQLEIREKELSAKYAATHPELKRVREQLVEAGEIMSLQPKDREETKMAMNPVRIGIQSQLVLAEADVRALEARVESLTKLHSKLVAQLNDVNELEMVAEDLKRKIEVGRENYHTYAQKLEESRINEALDNDSVSNITVFSAPSLEHKPASPKRSLLAIVAAMFSVCVGFATTLQADYKARTKEVEEIRSAEREHYLLTLRQQTIEATERLESREAGRQTARSESAKSQLENESSTEEGESTKLVKAK